MNLVSINIRPRWGRGIVGDVYCYQYATPTGFCGCLVNLISINIRPRLGRGIVEDGY